MIVDRVKKEVGTIIVRSFRAPQPHSARVYLHVLLMYMYSEGMGWDGKERRVKRMKKEKEKGRSVFFLLLVPFLFTLTFLVSFFSLPPYFSLSLFLSFSLHFFFSLLSFLHTHPFTSSFLASTPSPLFTIALSFPPHWHIQDTLIHITSNLSFCISYP